MDNPRFLSLGGGHPRHFLIAVAIWSTAWVMHGAACARCVGRVTSSAVVPRFGGGGGGRRARRRSREKMMRREILRAAEREILRAAAAAAATSPPQLQCHLQLLS